MADMNGGRLLIHTGFTVDTASYNKVQNQVKNISKSTTSISDGFKKMGSVAKGLGIAIGAAFSIKAITNFINESKKLYEVQMTAEKKLETVVRQRMGLKNSEIQQIKDYASTLQSLGVVGDEVQLSGAAQLATFLNQQKALTTLMPALNNLLVAQKGLNGTSTDAYNIGNMLGKVMTGQIGALKRVGISFTAAEEKMLTYGDEMERAAVLAQVITNNVGNMNEAMAKTPLGRQQQLKNTIGDIKEKFGLAAVNISTLFLPVLQKVAVWLDMVASAAIKVSTAIARVFGGKELKQSATPLSSIASDTDSAVSGLDDLGSAYEDAGKSASKASKGVLGFDSVIQANKPDSSSGGSSTSGGESAGISSIGSAMDSEEVDGQIDSIAEKIRKTIDSIKEYLKLNVEMPNLNFNTEKIKLDAQNILINIGEVFKTAGTFIVNIAFKFWNDIDGVGIIENVISLIAKVSTTLRQEIDAITPALTTFYEVGIAPIVQWIGIKLKDSLDFLGEQIAKVGVWFDENKETINAFAQTIGEVVNIIWGFIEPIADVAWKAFKTTLGLIVDALMVLATWLLENHKWILLIVASIAEMWVLVQIPVWIGAIASSVMNIVGIIKGAIGVVSTLFGIIAANPLMLIPLAIAAIVTAVIYLWNTNEGFRNFIIGAWEKIKEVFGVVWEGIKSAVSAGMEVLKGLVDFITGGFKNGFESSLGTIGKLIDNWIGTIKTVIGSIKTIFSGLIDFITGVFTGDWDKAFGGLKKIAEGIFKGVGSALILPFKQLITVWNSIVAKIGTLTIPEWVPIVGGKSFNLPSIKMPQLAQGGVVTGRTWATIGEAGPEVVMPLRNNSFTTAFAEDLIKAQSKFGSSNSSGGAEIHLHIQNLFGSDWATVAREVKKAMEQENVRIGGVAYDY